MVFLPIRKVKSSGFFYAFKWGAGVGAIVFLIVIGFFAAIWTDAVSKDETKSQIFLAASGKSISDKDVTMAVELVRKSFLSQKVSSADIKAVKESLAADKALGFAVSEWKRLEPILKDASAYERLDFDPDDWGDWLRISLWIFFIGVSCWASLAYWLISADPLDFSGYRKVNPERQASVTYPWATPLAIIFLPLYLPFILITQPLLFVYRLIRGIIFLLIAVVKRILPKPKPRSVQQVKAVASSKRRKNPPPKKELVLVEQAKNDLKKSKQEFVKFFRSGIKGLVSRSEESLVNLERESSRLSEKLEQVDRNIAFRENEVENLRSLANRKISSSDDVIASELDRILAIPGVVALSVKDKVFTIFTEPIKVEHSEEIFLLGRFILRFDMESANITVKNIDPENGPGNEQHPFAPNQNGNFCFGTIDEALTEFSRNMDFFALASAAMTAVRSVSGASRSKIMEWRRLGYAKKRKK